MAKHTQRAIENYSPLAVGAAIVSVPLAFLDVYFLRVPMAYIMGDSENSSLSWTAALALAVVALAMAALAGRFFSERERYSKPVVISLGVIWVLLGVLFFVIRIIAGLDPNFNIYNVSLSTTILEGVIFLVVFVADGLLGFLAGRELLNPHLHDYLYYKKQVDRLNKEATEKKACVEKYLNHMAQQELKKKALLDSMTMINNSYFSETVPSRMMALERRMRKNEILFGSAALLYERIGYDPYTAHPLNADNKRLLDGLARNDGAK